MTVLDNATKHFRAKLGGALKSLDVPEWETKIYFKDVITLKEQSKLVELAQAGKTTEALVETLITKARNEDGTKMFQTADKVVFMNEVDPQILVRVVGGMNEAAEVPTEDEVEKN
jgi:hypothetical protein